MVIVELKKVIQRAYDTSWWIHLYLWSVVSRVQESRMMVSILYSNSPTEASGWYLFYACLVLRDTCLVISVL
ncbi:unnamed protein product, partial [Larinioides sclopetarius]